MKGEKPIAKHGTSYAYKRRKCRCPLCRDWQMVRMRAYRRARYLAGRPVGTLRRRRKS